ncbi:TonB-dependent siderophore receptor (plasmid) [Trichormus variabilis ATCC 29413]|uniref:TonB-dependent siderophore receptor n=3 Tax=Anabaena variabilis TaxID=264691 RepID=Q3M2C4_TRIV2|nr:MULTISPECIES: TonB-dependent siderophore receptor [Nostocaceae]ABA24862.1 TonB-dependent siderophore receptor [Trichormus variabilis ATCC 29413]MBC1218003.1 TonB-dependent siderophore receptor [Trichormus variabilis ARAD]MBC1270769.1 TonB-dependent siderophore receptor [Trichormus variabilis FSR]MBC1305700.1 TonB-dependent siderophore receptor [Trichormus variabilis N2B]MBC1314642.1 TonB-dependent siderophore receptor [Trichormus variabilis PNB]
MRVKRHSLFAYLWLSYTISIFNTFPAYSQEIAIKDIPQLSEIQLPHTSIKELFAQQQNTVIQVTGVRLNQTPNSLEIILETPASDKLQVTNKSEGNNFIIDIPNAQLSLPNGNSFRQEKPFAGITEVVVTNQDANSIRVKVTGETAIPKVELDDSDAGLIFIVTPVISPTSETPANEPIELTVTGERDTYSVPDAITATRTDTPLRDIPQSIQVIPRQVIEDRNVVRLSELADNVSGVQPERGYGGVSSQGYRIRGFLTNFETLRNGFPDYGYFSPRDVANIERVEFLKGPAAVLYGGSPTQYAGGSGLVNTVTKKPLETPYYNASLTYGSYNFIRPTLDITGPLTDDKSVLYRLNVAYENADSFRDFVRNDSFFISPVIEWKVGEKTKITFEFEHQKYNLVFDQGLPIQPESLRLPRSRFLGEPNFANGNFTFNSFTYTLDSEFSKDWSFRQGFNVLGAKLDDAKYTYYGSLEDDRRTLNRFITASEEEHKNITFQNQISGKFSTGSIRHNVLFGVDLAYNLFNYIFAPDEELPIDIFNPQYGGTPISVGGEPFGRRIVSQNVGVFAQNLVELTPNFKILLGGRFDFNEYSREDRVTNELLNEQSDSRFSPRVGLVYQPTKTTSLYFNWTNGFSPQFQARGRTNEQFEPQNTEQFEVGVKQNFLNDKLSATLAFFQVTKQNVLTPDPVDSRFSVQTGEQESKGIEFDIAGEILPGWKVIANYAYIDGTVTKDNRIPVGDRLVGVPEHSLGLWTTYEFQTGSLQGLGLGLGLYYVGEQEVRLPNTFEVPSYVRADASVFYRRNNFRYALNFKNISNVKYYDLDGYNIDPAAPFTVLGTISVEF